jgi:hypothetical protein
LPPVLALLYLSGTDRLSFRFYRGRPKKEVSYLYDRMMEEGFDSMKVVTQSLDRGGIVGVVSFMKGRRDCGLWANPKEASMITRLSFEGSGYKGRIRGIGWGWDKTGTQVPFRGERGYQVLPWRLALRKRIQLTHGSGRR